MRGNENVWLERWGNLEKEEINVGDLSKMSEM
jgi:hypothetical protein